MAESAQKLLFELQLTGHRGSVVSCFLFRGRTIIGVRSFSHCTESFETIHPPPAAPTADLSFSLFLFLRVPVAGWYPKSLALLLTFSHRGPSFCFSRWWLVRDIEWADLYPATRENAYLYPAGPRSSCLFRRSPDRGFASDFSPVVVRGLLPRFFPSTSGGFMRRQEEPLRETSALREFRSIIPADLLFG